MSKIIYIGRRFVVILRPDVRDKPGWKLLCWNSFSFPCSRIDLKIHSIWNDVAESVLSLRASVYHVIYYT